MPPPSLSKGIFRLELALLLMVIFFTELSGRQVAERLMREAAVVVIDPFGKADLELEWAVPCERRRDPLIVRMTRSVSESPLGLAQVVKICLTPRSEQLIMNR